ncbi:MAG: carbon-nitrogen hydrolase family protein [Oscillospiraceae bacterium]|nr:carbon-nitrogen hydrolase family protein [Oscillospiraceae bacterium]
MIKIAICQLRTETDRAETSAKAKAMIYEAASKGADFVVLPEMYNTPYSREYFKRFADMGHADAVAQLSAWAKELKIYIVGGSVPERDKDGKIFNTCFIFDREGKEIARHRKIHLFDVELPGLRVRESATFSPGKDITVFETEYGTMGCAVCFDLRFPELFRAMQQRGAKLVFLPAQFSVATGPKYWEPMLKARAFDYQYYVVGAGAARYHGFHYESYGHSAVIDPTGACLCMAGEDEEILYADVDLEYVDEYRAQLPTSKLMRTDVYRLAE